MTYAVSPAHGPSTPNEPAVTMRACPHRSVGFREVGEYVCERDGGLVTYQVVVAG